MAGLMRGRWCGGQVLLRGWQGLGRGRGLGAPDWLARPEHGGYKRWRGQGAWLCDGGCCGSRLVCIPITITLVT